MCEAKDGDRTYLYMARSAMNGLQTKLKGASRAPLEKRLGKHGAPNRLCPGQARNAFPVRPLLSGRVRGTHADLRGPKPRPARPQSFALGDARQCLQLCPPSNGWTGAALATGVSMLPMELLFEELPHNFGYLYSEMQDYGDGFSVPTTEKTTWAEMTWIDGCCDGCRAREVSLGGHLEEAGCRRPRAPRGWHN